MLYYLGDLFILLAMTIINFHNFQLCKLADTMPCALLISTLFAFQCLADAWTRVHFYGFWFSAFVFHQLCIQ